MTRITEIYWFATSVFELVEMAISFALLCLIAWVVWCWLEKKVRRWCRGGRA